MYRFLYIEINLETIMKVSSTYLEISWIWVCFCYLVRTTLAQIRQSFVVIYTA